jgi:hypothetical protein
MDRRDTGANFQIIVDGRTRSSRDTRDSALEAALFLKERQPQSEVLVRDVQNDIQIMIGWKNGSTFSSEPVSLPQSRVTLVPRSN